MSEKELVDVYASIYKKEEEKVETITEAAPLVAAGLGALKVAGKVALKSAVKTAAANAGASAVGKLAGGGREQKGETVVLQSAEGKDAIEITDVVTPEPLKEKEEALEERLWDQVAANLTTLGEMGGVKFKVVPADEAEVEEKIEEGKKVKKWHDDDGDGISYEKGEVDGSFKKKKVKEGFNAKSPVTFSKKEEVVEDSKELQSKYASNILRADAALIAIQQNQVDAALDENRRAARAAGGFVDDSKKQTDPSKDGFTGISDDIGEIMRQNAAIKKADEAKKKAKKK